MGESEMSLHRLSLSRVGILALAIGIAGCAPLPLLDASNRTPSQAYTDTAGTPLGRAIAPEAARHPGLTGIEPIADGRVALAMRLALLRAATRSVDIQTFIWHADNAGTLLYEEVLRAAERGVRVRLLLDDVNAQGLDPVFALLDAQPNVQLRLYNPFTSRGSRGLGILGDFERLNRRMHNKSFTVDNQASIVGGRNIADEYFETGEGLSFADFDVLAVGAAVRAVSTQFDVYWNSGSAYPARLVIDREPARSRADFAEGAKRIAETPTSRAYEEAIRRTPQIQAMLAGETKFEWTTVRVVHDDPGKTLAESRDERQLQLLPKLIEAFGPPEKAFDLVSPYFVPGAEGTAALVALAQRGVRVRILTNSLAGTDEVSVHSGYARRRKDLLRAGVELFEIKPSAAPILQRGEEVGKHSAAGLHAKTFAVDRKKAFVGSFNFDPRSAKLNTEMGLVIDSARLAESLSARLDDASPALAYRVTLDADESLVWHDGLGGTVRDEPETSWVRRLKDRFFSWLPIEWLL
jgi:putative cardiolipin synthase